MLVKSEKEKINKFVVEDKRDRNQIFGILQWCVVFGTIEETLLACFRNNKSTKHCNLWITTKGI